MSDKYAYVVIIICSYMIMDVPKAFLVSLTIYTALGVLSILKSFYHEARPFFVTDLVPTKCWLEYGNPSGHSITSMSLYLTMWDIVCRRYRATDFTRRLTFCITVLVCLAIAFSRIYHGVHTYN
jgi:membrane-associated phospholipid phosphatase